MAMYYLNPATGKYELQGAPHVDAYSKGETDALIAAIPKGVEMELVWENASPSSSFEAQKISVDLSGEEDFYLCEFKIYVGDAHVMHEYLRKSKPVILDCAFTNGSATACGFRIVTPDNTGFNFSHGTIVQANSSNHCIPIRIYRVKGGKTT